MRSRLPGCQGIDDDTFARLRSPSGWRARQGQELVPSGRRAGGHRPLPLSRARPAEGSRLGRTGSCGEHL